MVGHHVMQASAAQVSFVLQSEPKHCLMGFLTPHSLVKRESKAQGQRKAGFLVYSTGGGPPVREEETGAFPTCTSVFILFDNRPRRDVFSVDSRCNAQES